MFYVSNFPEKTFRYTAINLEKDHISVTPWSLVRRPINTKIHRTHSKTTLMSARAASEADREFHASIYWYVNNIKPIFL